MMKHIVSPALFALALALPGLAAGETLETPAASQDERGVRPASGNNVTVERICDLIGAQAKANGIPETFFARLIWKESRFDHLAVSPLGAEGIAQFMPATAKMMNLADPFNIDQAIPASARHLSDLRKNLGNFGLAAAAYNAGEGRVWRWLSSGGFLPLETEDYVLDITGQPADDFAVRGTEVVATPLDPKLGFDEACRKMPVIAISTVAMASVNRKPWGIQLAGNFRRSAAINQYQRIQRRFASVMESHKPVVSRVRTPLGRRGIYAVRIGADTLREANRICASLKSAGGACIVTRNR